MLDGKIDDLCKMYSCLCELWDGEPLLEEKLIQLMRILIFTPKSLTAYIVTPILK